MSAYSLRPRAKKDLWGIAAYTYENWGEEQQDRYLETLHFGMESLSRNPNIGRAYDIIYPGLRKLPIGSHIILYLISDQGIDIVRILHHSMDIDRHL